MSNYSIYRLRLLVSLTIGLLSSYGYAAPLTDQGTVFFFDAGPQDSAVDSGSIAISLNENFSSETGFGWTQVPGGDFTRTRLSRSRNALTIDGVSGINLGFRANVSPGKWHIAVWLEANRPGDSLGVIRLQGDVQKLGWQKFSPSAEPNSTRPKTYRVHRAVVIADSAGVTVELGGAGQEVRLLGISLVRAADERRTDTDEFHRMLALAGSYDSLVPLSKLIKQIDVELEKRPNDVFYIEWRERLNLLIEAERFFNMRGWEWANEKTGMGMFDRLYQAVMCVDGLLGTDASQAAPISGRAAYLRGRILYWLHREGAGETVRAGAVRDLGRLYAANPSSKILAMYCGKKIDMPDSCDVLAATKNAPAWSIAQREALCRMRQIAHWWVEEQQAENGEFGGKLGDDVELLRWWAPLVLLGDPVAIKGWERLANGVWASDLTHNGYAAKISDVEHASEFLSDTAPMLAVISDSRLYQQRLSYSAKHFENLWTGENQQGHRLFRSAWFSSTAIDERPPRDRDLEYNTRATQALRYLAWRKHDPRLIELLHQWSSAWVSAAMRTDKGKPAGIIPASIRFSDASINGDEPTWYLANMYWKYFDWEHHAGSLMLDQLLFTHSLTQDERLLQPMLLALELIRIEEASLDLENNEPTAPRGSKAWVAQTLASKRLFWNVVEQWRFSTDDSRWDDLILRYGTHFGRYRLSSDESYLTAGLHELLEGVRYNIPLMTTEAIHTDRVYVPHAELLKGMLMGDGVKGNLSPYYAVSWEATDENFTALVTEASADQLTVKIYSHAEHESSAVMRLWQLEPAEYLFLQKPEPREQQPTEAIPESILITEKGHRLAIRLPAQQSTVISISQKREDSTHQRD